MIRLKSPEEIELMARAGALVGECHDLVRGAIKPGISTAELNELVEKRIVDAGAIAAFKGYGSPGMVPFPAACCMSPDEEVVHGFPSEKPLVEGQIISVDIGVKLGEWYGDAARTFAVGNISPELQSLLIETEKSLHLGIEKAVDGATIGDIGYAIESHVGKFGYGVVRDLVGHGIGKDLHEEPQVPNYGRPGKGLKLRNGMVIAIDPMINLGTWRVNILDDGWTVITEDRKASAHFEHTVAITENGPRILTPDP